MDMLYLQMGTALSNSIISIILPTSAHLIIPIVGEEKAIQLDSSLFMEGGTIRLDKFGWVKVPSLFPMPVRW
jgi:hypothetical protein